MAKTTKKEEPKTIIHDFSVEPIFRGWLLSESPESYLFEDEDGEEITIAKTEGLNKAMQVPVNGVAVKQGKWLIELEFLGETTRNDLPYQKFRVSVEQD